MSFLVKAGKIFGGFIAFILIVLLLVQITLFFFTKPLFGDLIKETVYDSSKGVYQVDFENISIDLFGGSLKITGLLVNADSTRFYELAERGEATPSFFDGSIDKFEIIGIRYLPMLNNKLAINGIIVKDPKAYIAYHPDFAVEEEPETEFDYQNPGALLPDILSAVNLKRFSLSNAKVMVQMKEAAQKQVFSVDSLTFEIDNFYVDKETRPEPDRFLYSDNILLKIQGFSQSIPGVPYYINVGLIGFETLNMELFGKNIAFSPLRQQNNAQDQPVASVRVPEFSISGIGLHGYMTDSVAHIKSISFLSPSLDLYMKGLMNGQEGTEEQEERGGEDEDGDGGTVHPYEMISGFMESLKIDSFLIHNASVNVYDIDADSVKVAEVHKLSLGFDGLNLYEGAEMFAPQKMFFADNYFLNAEGYSALVPNFGYSVSGTSLKMNTKNAMAAVNGLLIKPEPKAGTKDAPEIDFNAYLPHFSITNVDLPLYFNRNSVQIGRIYIDKPNLKVDGLVLESDESSEPIDLENLYSYIDGILTSVNVGSIDFANGQIEVHGKGSEAKNIFTSKNMNFGLKNFYLDREAKMGPSSFLFAKDISLLIGSFSIGMPDFTYIIQGSEFKVTTGGENIYARNIELVPTTNELDQFNLDGPYIPYSASLPELRINGINFFNILLRNQIQLKDIIVQSPQIVVFYDPAKEENDQDKDQQVDAQEQPIDIENLYALIEDDWKVISFNNFKIEHAGLKFMQMDYVPVSLLDVDDFNLAITNFSLDEEAKLEPGRALYADNIDVIIKDVFMKTPDSLHIVNVGQFGLVTSESIIYGVGLNMFPRGDKDFRSALDIEENEGPMDFYSISLPEFRITGVDFNKALAKRNLEIDEIVFQQPSGSITTALYQITRESEQDMLMEPEDEESDGQASDDQVPPTEIELYPYISEYLETLKINKFLIEGASASMHGIRFMGDTLNMFTLDRMTFLLTGFQIDSTSNALMEKPFFADDLYIDLFGVKFTTPDTLYTVNLRELNISSTDSLVFIDSLKMTPRFGIFEFADKIGEAVTRTELSNRKISVSGFNLMGLLLGQRIEIARVDWEDLTVTIFNDGRYPDPRGQDTGNNEESYIAMPQKYLRESRYYIDIDSVFIKNGDILFAFLNKELDYPANFHLGDLNFEAYNITNDSLKIIQDVTTSAYFTAELMGSGLLNVNLNFLTGDINNNYTMHGSLDSLKFDRISPVLGMLTNVEIAGGGGINALEFSLFGDHLVTEGTVRVFFEGLELHLQRNEDSLNIFQRTLKALEWFVNNYIIYFENPEPGGPYIANFVYERGRRESFTEYIGSALIEGMVSSLIAPVRVARQVGFPLFDWIFGSGTVEEVDGPGDEGMVADPDDEEQRDKR